jgi:hypothetical protein
MKETHLIASTQHPSLRRKTKKNFISIDSKLYTQNKPIKNSHVQIHCNRNGDQPQRIYRVDNEKVKLSNLNTFRDASPYINTETRLAPRIFSPNNTSLSSEESNGETMTMEDLARA